MRRPLWKVTHALLVGLCLLACASTGPERETQVIKTAIDAGKLACGAAAAKRVKLTNEQRTWCEGR